MERLRAAAGAILDGEPADGPLPRGLALALRDRPRTALVDVVARALAEFPPDPDELAGFDRAGLLAYAETNLGLGARRDAAEAANPLVRERDRVLAEARHAPARWSWLSRGPDRHRAEIALGRLRFAVDFWRRGTEWNQAWTGGDDLTTGLLNHLDRIARRGERVRTGLFPAIDRCLGAILRDFMDGVEPQLLRVDGLDARRNAYNRATYGGHAPEGYAVEPILAHGDARATRDGVVGIRLVRPPALAPRP